MVSVSSLAAAVVVCPDTGAVGKIPLAEESNEQATQQGFQGALRRSRHGVAPNNLPVGQSDGGFFPNAERNYD